MFTLGPKVNVWRGMENKCMCLCIHPDICVYVFINRDIHHFLICVHVCVSFCSQIFVYILVCILRHCLKIHRCMRICLSISLLAYLSVNVKVWVSNSVQMCVHGCVRACKCVCVCVRVWETEREGEAFRGRRSRRGTDKVGGAWQDDWQFSSRRAHHYYRIQLLSPCHCLHPAQYHYRQDIIGWGWECADCWPTKRALSW